MKFEFHSKNLKDLVADFELVFVQDKKTNAYKDAKSLFELNDYKGEGVCLDSAKKRLFVELKSCAYEDIRLAFASAYKALCKMNVKSIKTPSVLGECVVMSFASIVQGFLFAAYKFDKYKSEKKPAKIAKILISTQELNGKKFSIDEAKTGIKIGEILSNATNFTKDIVMKFHSPTPRLKWQKMP